MTNLRGPRSFFLIARPFQMQYIFTKSLVNMHNTRFGTLWAASDHFVINILWCTSINLELSVNGRQTLPGDFVRGSSVKSSTLLWLTAFLRAVFETGFLLFFCRKAKRCLFYMSAVCNAVCRGCYQSTESDWESRWRVWHIVMMISVQWQCLFAIYFMPLFMCCVFKAIFLSKSSYLCILK